MSLGKKLCQGAVVISVLGGVAQAEPKAPVVKTAEADQDQKESVLPKVIADLLVTISSIGSIEPIC